MRCEPGGRELTQREEEEGGCQAAGAEVVLDVSPAVGAAHPDSTEVRQLGSGQDIYSMLGWELKLQEASGSLVLLMVAIVVVMVAVLVVVVLVVGRGCGMLMTTIWTTSYVMAILTFIDFVSDIKIYSDSRVWHTQHVFDWYWEE